MLLFLDRSLGVYEERSLPRGFEVFQNYQPLPQGLRISHSVSSLSTFLVQNHLEITVPIQTLLAGPHFLQAPRRNLFRSKRKGVLE